MPGKNAKTPPMGWNSWDCYGAAVNEKIVRENAEFMATHLKRYGWEYIVADIQWYEPAAVSHNYNPFTELETDGFSRLIPAVNRFPSSADGNGFKPLANYVHSLGLKFGIHILRGIPRQAVHQNTPILGTSITARQIAHTASICRWNTDMYGVNPKAPGSAEYYNSLFKLYAEWGVDFVKVDDIANHYAQDELDLICRAIKESNREMVLSISPGPTPYEKREHLRENVNMWRITDDFWDRWDLLYDMFDRAELWHDEAIEGHWPDCDMLPIGAISQCYNPNNWTDFTKDEQKTMMSLWCMVRSPLMIGAEMTKLDEFSLSLLTNTELLGILNKSHNSRLLFRNKHVHKELIGWYAENADGEYFIALFNTGEAEETITVNLGDYSLPGKRNALDIWSGEQTTVDGSLTCKVNPHGVRLFKLFD